MDGDLLVDGDGAGLDVLVTGAIVVGAAGLLDVPDGLTDGGPTGAVLTGAVLTGAVPTGAVLTGGGLTTTGLLMIDVPAGADAGAETETDCDPDAAVGADEDAVL